MIWLLIKIGITNWHGAVLSTYKTSLICYVDPPVAVVGVKTLKDDKGRR